MKTKRILMFAVVIICLISLTFGVVDMSLAQEPPIDGSEQISFPPVPDDPSQLPEWFLQVGILLGTGLVAKLLTDAVKLIPWIPAPEDNENVRKQVLRLSSVTIAFVVSLLLPVLPVVGESINSVGILKDMDMGSLFAVVLSSQWGAHRLDKLLRGASYWIYSNGVGTRVEAFSETLKIKD